METGITEMSKDDSLKPCPNMPPEQKLAILRMEMLNPMSVIRGYSRIIKERVTPDTTADLPNEFVDWIDRVIEAGDNLKELLEVLSG